MPLDLYSQAPDFSLKDISNNPFSLSNQLILSPVILFFYPKAFTPVCTQEVCSFRDDFSFFNERGIQLFGVSMDSRETLQKFQKENQLPYTLLSDPSHRVCKIYKAMYPFGILSKRISYYIAQDGRVLGVIDSLFSGTEHTQFLKDRILYLESLEKTLKSGNSK